MRSIWHHYPSTAETQEKNVISGKKKLRSIISEDTGEICFTALQEVGFGIDGSYMQEIGT
jgi:hypothetical protein